MQSVLLQVQHLQYVTEQLVNLELDTKEQEILHDINFTIQTGEFVGLVGPNGSGKTTLSKLLTRILEPTQGHIFIDGIDYQAFTPEWKLHQEISLVFQNVDVQFVGPNFQEDMELYLGNFNWSSAQIQKRIKEISQQLQVEALIKRPFKSLSGGQKQLLAIAEALAVQPKLLILDEPTAQLDPENTQLVLDCLQQLHQQQNVTVLLITHKLEELNLTNRTLILNQGTIAKSCNTVDLLVNDSLLRANQLPIPDTVAIVNYLQRQFNQTITLPTADLNTFVKTMKGYLC